MICARISTRSAGVHEDISMRASVKWAVEGSWWMSRCLKWSYEGNSSGPSHVAQLCHNFCSIPRRGMGSDRQVSERYRRHKHGFHLIAILPLNSLARQTKVARRQPRTEQNLLADNHHHDSSFRNVLGRSATLVHGIPRRLDSTRSTAHTLLSSHDTVHIVCRACRR